MMRRKLFCLLASVLVLVSLGTFVFAEDNFLQFKELPPREDLGEIVSFDVSDKLLLAFDTNKIAVYNLNGKQEKVFQIHMDGAYYVSWDGENIRIYSQRANSLTEVMQDGRIVSELSVNDDVLERLSRKTNIQVGSTRYTLQKATVLSANYAKLVRTDQNGETVLYDCSSRSMGSAVFFACSFLLILVLSFSIARSKQKEARENRKMGL